MNVDRTLRTLVETLLFVLKDGELTVGPGVGRRLWRVLIEAPNAFVASETDEKQLEKALTARSQGMGWMTELLMVPPRVMTSECVAQLLKDCIETQPANIMTLRGTALRISQIRQHAVCPYSSCEGTSSLCPDCSDRLR